MLKNVQRSLLSVLALRGPEVFSRVEPGNVRFDRPRPESIGPAGRRGCPSEGQGRSFRHDLHFDGYMGLIVGIGELVTESKKS
jgi:hypothetical protein